MIFFLFVQLARDTVLSDTTNTVNYSAKNITYDLEKSLVILNDSSLITYQDIKLFSDSAYYYVDSNQLHAYGNCHLKQLDDSIKGNYLKYNLETKKAMMTSGKTQIEKGFIEGEQIYWVREKVVNAYDGKYTTCSDSPPHYYFYSPKMKVFLGDMVIARPIYLYIYDLPIIALPFWFVPISSKRKSGLLPFKLGNSRDFGKFIRGFAYYFVISDYADATFQLDAMEKRGIMPHLEGVWDFNPFSAGTILGSYIRESDTLHIQSRYSIEARNNSPYFLFGSNFNCDIKYSSDNTFRSDYAETTIIWVDRELVSQATLNRDFSGIRNSLAYERRVIFVGDTTYEKFPQYSVTTPSQILFSLINYSFTGHLSRNRTTTADSKNEASGANIHTTPTIQQNILNLFTISPRVDLDLAVYGEDTAGNKLPTRLGYSFGTGANTNLYRLFDVEIFGIHGVLHKLTPNLNYTYTPDFGVSRFPPVPGIPQYGRTNNMGFGVRQEFEAKLGEKKEKKNIMRIDLFSGYNLLNDTLSPINFSLDLPLNPFPKPITNFNSRITGSVNYYTKEYTYTIANGTSIKTDHISFNLNQTYTKGGVYQIWFNGDIKPTRHWLISYSARYDWQLKKLVDYRFSLSRNLHCWEGVFSFSQLAQDWRYDFKVRIKEIPEVAIGRGLLGYIIE